MPQLFPGVLDEVRFDSAQAQTTQSVGFWNQPAHVQGLPAENYSFPNANQADESFWPEQAEQNGVETAGALDPLHARGDINPSIELLGSDGWSSGGTKGL